MNKTLSEQQKSWLILAVLWLALLILASLRPFAVPDEGRYGEIGRWMLVSGDWLTPRLNGIPFFHKPPYLYWLEAISVAIFGVSELALRLVPALHAGLMLSALYLAARRISTERIARRAVIMLGSSLGFLVGGQYINHDMLVASWIGVAIWCFAFAFMAGDKPNPGLARLGFVACALGMLSKGLIGLALPGLVILVWLIWTRQLKKILHFPWLSGLALFLAIALPWFVLAQRTYPEFFNYMFIGQQLNRYTAAVYNNPQPVWFYVLALALLLFPWMFFAFNQMRRVTATTLASEVSMTDTWWKLCWSWLLVILVFFSIPNSKLVGYILPVVPPLALLASMGWQRAMAHRAASGKIFAGICLVNGVIALGIVLKVGDVTRASRTQDLAQVLACAAQPSDTVYVSDAFPYDLPLYAQTIQPMVVLNDWPMLRQQAGDGWQRELFEGADFDAHAAQVLQPLSVLAQVAHTPGHWFAGRSGSTLVSNQPGWTLYFKGAGWDLYRSGGGTAEVSAAKSPEPAQHKGLPGCKQQR
ncbi:undecaprenyl phosphate-alpha-4-amino-4-deoxy-L-arabinose arabinosyl transferase [Rhodoferax lithotrophicus]|uniref:Undecaprenyl phosphate-alpha-4-amino-4-deoxy-L-arabinose arabinosyl transferase n=1 Tax=Rhodoferax lithotrophicus TaxID=2798804 RepID=A0ABN6D682_9BURK|nr:glycosyltransferase family 39 protein [Rhodoferax sp. MIZ03]BCO26314.1 undecaprenyl phosphate-alpha-4-amino-4-deoxy-L-arabinose arabinosyl transferase [Rhodoferax sp. MIZ03]